MVNLGQLYSLLSQCFIFFWATLLLTRSFRVKLQSLHSVGHGTGTPRRRTFATHTKTSLAMRYTHSFYNFSYLMKKARDKVKERNLSIHWARGAHLSCLRPQVYFTCIGDTSMLYQPFGWTSSLLRINQKTDTALKCSSKYVNIARFPNSISYSIYSIRTKAISSDGYLVSVFYAHKDWSPWKMYSHD